jgi:hypothetical protein
MKKLILSLIILFTFTSSFAQQTDDLVNMIKVKLEKDKKYLNVYSLPLEMDKKQDSDILVLPRTNRKEPFQFKFGDEYQYRIVILKDGLDLDSLQLLYIEEIKLNSLASGGLFESVTPPKDDTTKVINFEDMFNLRVNYPAIYKKLYYKVETYIMVNEDTPLESLLRITPDDNIRKSFGFASRDMTDYIRFQHFNEPAHWYPKLNQKKKSFGRNKGNTETNFHFDVSLNSFSFSHSFMQFGIGGASLEMDVKEDVLNLLPMQNMLLDAGFRTLFMLGDKKTPKQNTYIDAKFQVRWFMSHKTSLDGFWQFNNNPLIMADEPRLNFTTGILSDITITRPFTLPDMRLYFSVSGSDLSEANAYLTGNRHINNGGTYAYFSLSQIHYSMSFYWNADEKMENMFRLDAGFGYYDIWRAEYNGNNYKSKELIQNKVMPSIKLWYTFVPKDLPLLATSFKIFDAQLTISAWIRLLNINNHNVRFDIEYITAPLGRKLRDWETKGGLALNLRYRYGL